MQEIDQDIVVELLKHISQEDYNQLVREFIAETSELLNTISEEDYEANKEAVVRAVHSIKGSAITLGFYRLSNYSAELEEVLKIGIMKEKSDIFALYRARVLNTLGKIQFL